MNTDTRRRANTVPNRTLRVRRVTLEVYCLSEYAKLVRDELDGAFFSSEVGLWRPRRAQVGSGDPKDAARAARWFQTEEVL